MLALVLLGSGGAAAWEPEPPELASLAGERLEFRLRWGVITAAEATLEVEALPSGELLFRATARTVPFLDVIYPVRDLVESNVRLPGPRAKHYYKRAREGHGEARTEEIFFDSTSGQARLERNGEVLETLTVPAEVQDPLSCLYAYRAAVVADDGTIELPITDGKRVINGRVRVHGRETLDTPAGRFDTVIVEPDIEALGGIFKKSPGARIFIWLTDDKWRRPVKLQSKVSVGHFTAELVSWRHEPGKTTASN